MSDFSSQLEILLKINDQASAGIANLAGNASSSFDKIAEKAKAVGEGMVVVGTAITGALGFAVDKAAEEQTATVQMDTTIGNVITTAKKAADAHSAYATQVGFLEGKINSAKASIALATAEIDKHGKVTSTTAASHDKLRASIANQEVTINKYQQQLDLLTNTQTLAGASVDSVASSFDAAAEKGTSFGFMIDESKKSLTNLFASTHSQAQALEAYTIAENLARAKGVDLQTATGYVEKAFQGQGRALIDLGINLKDGLSGMQALNAINDVTANSAQNFAATQAGAIDVMKAKQDELIVKIGTQLLPITTKLTQQFSDIITKITDWTNKHPDLTRNITLLVAGIGLLLIPLGTLLIMLPGLAVAFTILTGPVGIVIALLAVIAGAFYLIYTQWSGAWDTIKLLWGVIVDTINTKWNEIKLSFDKALKIIDDGWRSTWTGIKDFVLAIWDGIVTGIKGAINTIIDGINFFIGAIDKVQIHIPAIGVGAVKTPAFDWSGVNLAMIPHLAAGGIVTSPTLALIGESGPEAVMPLGSGGAGATIININIMGGTYLDQDAARQIGDKIARAVNMQLKLRTI